MSSSLKDYNRFGSLSEATYEINIPEDKIKIKTNPRYYGIIELFNKIGRTQIKNWDDEDKFSLYNIQEYVLDLIDEAYNKIAKLHEEGKDISGYLFLANDLRGSKKSSIDYLKDRINDFEDNNSCSDITDYISQFVDNIGKDYLSDDLFIELSESYKRYHSVLQILRDLIKSNKLEFKIKYSDIETIKEFDPNKYDDLFIDPLNSYVVDRNLTICNNLLVSKDEFQTYIKSEFLEIVGRKNMDISDVNDERRKHGKMHAEKAPTSILKNAVINHMQEIIAPIVTEKWSKKTSNNKGELEYKYNEDHTVMTDYILEYIANSNNESEYLLQDDKGNIFNLKEQYICFAGGIKQESKKYRGIKKLFKSVEGHVREQLIEIAKKAPEYKKRNLIKGI
ncbi:MAG: hypothetical protein HOH73_00545 [Alphaproteobacteria bacterium]|jgi:hypothetical protein|nr:hypothetical protein [Alphaproteobacteria bacterium]